MANNNLPIPIDSDLALEAHIAKLERMDMGDKIDTFFSNGWSVPLAARALGVSRKAFRLYMKRNTEFRLLVNRYESVLIAKAESKLQELIEEKNFPAIKFFLERRSPKRYGQRVELVETEDNKKPKVKITAEMTLEEAQRVYASEMIKDVTPKKKK